MKTAVNLRSLDSLRGLLSVYVLAGHARWLLWAGWETWRQQPHGTLIVAVTAASAALRYAHEAVMVFFVLSGFFIHFRAAGDLAAGNGAHEFNTGDFFRRRARRLVPPYAFALLLTVALDLLGRHLYSTLYQGTTGDALLDGNVGRGGFTLASVLPALCLLPSSAGVHFGSDGPLWSLAYEVIYYALYPLWLMCRCRAGAAVAYGLGGALAAAGLAAPVLRDHFPGSVLVHYPVWLAGAGLVELCARTTWPDWSRWAAVILAAGGFVGMQWQPAQLWVAIILYALAGAAAVLFFVLLPTRFSDGSAGRLTERLGMGSYTIYICHFPVLVLLSAGIFHFWGQRPLGGGAAFGGGVGALVLCCLFYLWCERPFLTNRRRQHLQPSPA